MAQVKIPRRTVWLIAALGVVLVAALVRRPSSKPGAAVAGRGVPGTNADAATVNAWVELQTREFVDLEKREEEFLAGPWAAASEAARHEDVLFEYWNGLNQLDRDLKTIPVFQLDAIEIPEVGRPGVIGNGIQMWHAGGGGVAG